MSGQDWLPLVACGGQLGLAAVALSRGSASPLSLSLALLCLSLFSWNFSTLAYRVTGASAFRYVDAAMSPLSVPFAVNFVASFVGRRRELRRELTIGWALFGALGATAIAAFVSPAAAAFVGSPTWALVFLLSAVGGIGLTAGLLFAHLRRVRDAEERLRTRLVSVALIVGSVLSMTELLADMGFTVPRGGSLGALVAAGVLTLLTLRFRLLEQALSSRVVMYSVALGALAVSAYLGVFYFLQANAATVLLGTVAVTLASFAVTRQIVQGFSVQRDRLQKLAVLGRFSGQMAHDLKNPIAALKGAAQFLREELARGRPASAAFVDLICEQVERLEVAVDRYHRLGKLEAVRTPSSMNDIVARALSLEGFALPKGTRLVTELGSDLPLASLDEPLLARALSNLVQNAVEALPAGGTVTVRTAELLDAEGRRGVEVRVEDTGTGMDPRAVERVFDDFFTTKPHGTGIGLFFVKRVAEAHGGDVSIDSQPGQGTVARLWVPSG